MNLDRYIAFSVFCHLIFVALFGFLDFTRYSSPSVFNVRIAEPLAPIKIPAVKKKKPVIINEPPKIEAPRTTKPDDLLPEITIKPETLLGDGDKAMPESITKSAPPRSPKETEKQNVREEKPASSPEPATEKTVLTAPESQELSVKKEKVDIIEKEYDFIDIPEKQEDRKLEKETELPIEMSETEIEKKTLTARKLPEPSAQEESFDPAAGEDSLSDIPAREDKDPQIEKAEPYLAPPSALFDNKIIEKFASRSPLPQRGLSFDSEGFKHRGYMRMLRDRIEKTWKYPKEAARRGISGDLYIKFTILRNGKLENVELVIPSGYRELDMAAIKALKKAEPFWPLPDAWEGDKLEIKGHFIYIVGPGYSM